MRSDARNAGFSRRRKVYDNKPGPRIRAPRAGAGLKTFAEDRPAAGLLKSALASFGLTDDIGKIFEAWDELPSGIRAGARIAAAGRGTVFLEVPSAAAMHSIFYNKAAIISALNRRAGTPCVRDIKLEIVGKGNPKKP